MGALYNALTLLGVNCWRDMSQQSITTEAMMRGVRDSDIFVLVLTNSTLSRWFCLFEIACAIAFKKPIAILVENNATFWQWDAERWRNDMCSRVSDSSTAELRSWSKAPLQVAYAALQGLSFAAQAQKYGVAALARVGGADIRKLIEEQLAEGLMLPHRRRGFEYAAMLRALVQRAGLSMPGDEGGVEEAAQQQRSIAIVSRRSGAGAAIAAEIGRSLLAAGQARASVEAASHVLVVLTVSVLEDEGVLAQLRRALLLRSEMDEGRAGAYMHFVMSKADGWSFVPSAAELAAQDATAGAIRGMLGDVEVMTCRRAGGPLDYEHRAMVAELLQRMRGGAAGGAAGSAAANLETTAPGAAASASQPSFAAQCALGDGVIDGPGLPGLATDTNDTPAAGRADGGQPVQASAPQAALSAGEAGLTPAVSPMALAATAGGAPTAGAGSPRRKLHAAAQMDALVQAMCAETEQMTKRLAAQKGQLAQQNEQLATKDAREHEMAKQLAAKHAQLAEQQAQVAAKTQGEAAAATAASVAAHGGAAPVQVQRAAEVAAAGRHGRALEVLESAGVELPADQLALARDAAIAAERPADADALRAMGAVTSAELDAKRRALLGAVRQGGGGGVQAALEAGADPLGVQAAGRLPRAELLFRHFDADGDGALSCAEFAEYYKVSGTWAALGYQDATFEAAEWPGACTRWGAEPAAGIPLAAWNKRWLRLGDARLEEDFAAAFPHGHLQDETALTAAVVAGEPAVLATLLGSQRHSSCRGAGAAAARGGGCGGRWAGGVDGAAVRRRRCGPATCGGRREARARPSAGGPQRRWRGAAGRAAGGVAGPGGVGKAAGGRGGAAAAARRPGAGRRRRQGAAGSAGSAGRHRGCKAAGGGRRGAGGRAGGEEGAPRGRGGDGELRVRHPCCPRRCPAVLW